jgi:hypothetical protein
MAVKGTIVRKERTKRKNWLNLRVELEKTMSNLVEKSNLLNQFKL